MIKIIANNPSNAEMRNRPFELEEGITLENFLRHEVGKSEEDLDKLFSKGDGASAMLLFVNGVLCRERDYVLQDQDRILITGMVCGG